MIFKKFTKLLNERKREKRILFYLKHFLRGGCYYFDYLETSIKILQRANLRKVLHTHFILFKRKKNESYNKIIFLKSTVKTCYFVNKLIYLQPNTGRRYNIIKENYLLYLKQFSYPHATYYLFDDKKKIIIMERVYGRQFNDFFHNKKVVSKLLKYAILAPKSNNEQLYYLQHGDVNSGNLVWKNDSEFLFIDLDNVGFYPMLFDIIHYTSSFLTADQLLSILEENQDDVDILLNKYDLNYDNPSLDIVFSQYVAWYSKHAQPLIDDYVFLKQLDNTSFPETNKVFCELSTLYR